MRRINTFVTACIMVLFLVHMITGGMQLMGILRGGIMPLKVMSYIMLAFVVIHMIIGIKLTIDTLRISKKAGVSYFKENRLFWIRRISGIALVFFMASHVFIFTGKGAGAGYRLVNFDIVALVSQILMVISLFVHLITNISPLKIAMGIKDKGNIKTDIIFVFSILLLLAGLAFFVYFLRWITV